MYHIFTHSISCFILIITLGLNLGCTVEVGGLNADAAQPPAATFPTKSRVASLSFSPDGQLLAAAEINGGPGQNNQWTSADPLITTIALRHIPDGEVVHTLTGHTHLVWSVAFSPVGDTLASGSMDNTIKLWDVQSESLLNSWSPPTAHSDGALRGVLSVGFSPDGQILAAAGVDEIWLWRVADGSVLLTLSDRPRLPTIAFSPDGQMIATRNQDKAIELWRVSDGQKIITLPEADPGLCPPVFSADGQFIAACQRRGTINLLRVSDGKVATTIAGHPGGTWRVAFGSASEETILASVGTEGQTGSGENVQPLSAPRLWRVKDGQLLNTFKAESGFNQAVAFSPSGEWLASGGDYAIKLWPVTAK
jgi:WD40 repeat protein